MKRFARYLSFVNIACCRVGHSAYQFQNSNFVMDEVAQIANLTIVALFHQTPEYYVKFDM